MKFIRDCNIMWESKQMLKQLKLLKEAVCKVLECLMEQCWSPLEKIKHSYLLGIMEAAKPTPKAAMKTYAKKMKQSCFWQFGYSGSQWKAAFCHWAPRLTGEWILFHSYYVEQHLFFYYNQ